VNVLGLFRRAAAPPAPDTSALGTRTVALRLPGGCAVPAGCCCVVVSEAGARRRASPGRLMLAPGEQAWCFHPGPYTADIVPFAVAPELGLCASFAVDSPDPRQSQQRFDLFLASEGGAQVELASLVQAIQEAVRRELAQGNLDLPPCTTLDEWNAFRAGFNRLLYTRFGLTVDDCVPVDLGDSVDFGAILRARTAAAEPAQTPVPQAPQEAAPFDPTEADAGALRRLFRELPCLMCQLRVAVLPPGQDLFRQQQALLRRLDLASLSVGTMPALELAAPGQPLAAVEQLRRARHSRRAALGLDEAWALLARFELAGEGALPALFDEADRIVANLERDIAARRALTIEAEEP
jgi:hypothetical protein